MKRELEIKKIEKGVKAFLKQNPKVKKAMDVFGMTYNQYRQITEEKYTFYTGVTTNKTRCVLKCK